MNKKFETINDFIYEMNKERDLPKEYNTYRDVVDELVSMGNSDHVYAFHDDHLSLESELGEDFLDQEIGNENDEDNEKIDFILDEANTIIPLSNMELTEERVECIKEDMMIRGEDPDDFEI